jgi:tryptophan synthase alpha chain
MSRIGTLFQQADHKILNIYVTAGYPKLESTLPVMKAIQDAGADLIELGMPYSDPLADGPVIQSSGSQAIANGMTIPMLFQQLQHMRDQIRVPVILMGYMNPVLQYGFEKFCADASGCGVDGLIIPDLPAFEFEQMYGSVLKKFGLDFVFLVTPETSEERVRKLDALSEGFLYAVSSSSTTGQDQDMRAAGRYLDRLNAMGLKNPVLVGFGIGDRQSYLSASSKAAGAIIGTAFIRHIGAADDPVKAAEVFVRDILGETKA